LKKLSTFADRMISRCDVRRQLISVLSFEILIEFNIGNQVHGKFISFKLKKFIPPCTSVGGMRINQCSTAPAVPMAQIWRAKAQIH